MKPKLFTAQLPLGLLLCLLLSSCYSVRIADKQGIPDPDITQMEKGYYRGKKVVTIDTTVNLSLLDNETMFLESCGGMGFHSVEYRVTLGYVLLSGITLGKKRKVHVRYVCIKETN